MGRQQGRKGGGGKGAFRAGKEGKDTEPHAEKRSRDDGTWNLDQRELSQLSNAAFERYYTRQPFMNTAAGVWETCYASLKVPLPSASRINRNHPDCKKVGELLVKEFRHNGFSFDLDKVNDTPRDDTSSAPLPLLRSLPFLHTPLLGLQAPLSRGEIKRQIAFKRLKKLLAAFNEGGVLTRQETVSMVPPLMLDVKPGMSVLDMCAAPGSKTSQLLEALVAGGYDEPTPSDSIGLDPFNLAKAKGVVVANDVNIARIDVLTHQTGRAAHSHPNLIITNNDATNFPLIMNEADKFDRVLCDVMCSGDGTLRKSLDLWSRWNPLQGADLHPSQLRTLLRGMSLVKPGGVVVYSTCSLNPIEDEAVIAEALLQAKGAFELVDVSTLEDGTTNNALFDNVTAPPLNSGPYTVAHRLVPGLRYSPGVTSWTISNKEGDAFFTNFEEAAEYRREVMKDKGFQYRTSMFPPTANTKDEVQLEQLAAVAKSLGPDVPASVDCLHLERSMRIMPHLQDTGGFFVAALRCKSNFTALETNNARRYKQEEELKKQIAEGKKETPYVSVAGSVFEKAVADALSIDPTHFPFDRLFVRREAYHQLVSDPIAEGANATDSRRGPRVAKLFLATAEAARMMNRFPNSVNIKQIGIKAFESYKYHSLSFRIFAESLDTLVPYLSSQQRAQHMAAPSGATTRTFFVRAPSVSSVEWLINVQEKSAGRTTLLELATHLQICISEGNSREWTSHQSSLAEWRTKVAKGFAIVCPFFNKEEALAAADEGQRDLQTALCSLSPVVVAGEIDDGLVYAHIKMLPHTLTLLKLSLTGSVEDGQGAEAPPSIAAEGDAPLNNKSRERDTEEGNSCENTE